MRRQTTIRREVSCSGIGLHSGQRAELKLRPALPGAGITIVRTDLGGKVIPAIPANLDLCNYATMLSHDGATVRTIEHLLSALYGTGIDNVLVEVDADEIPILDGSAVPFLDLLADAGTRELGEPCQMLEVTRPVNLVESGKEIVVLPSPTFRVSYHIDFAHPAIGNQECTFELDPITYAREIAPARTFTFVREVEALREAGLAQGGSLTNAVVLDDQRLLNSTLRFKDEFVRHKILDLIGDLALLGRPLLGHVMALKAGHDLHGRLVADLLAREDCWRPVLDPTPRPAGTASAGFGVRASS